MSELDERREVRLAEVRDEIRRTRTFDVLRTVSTWMWTGQLLFASFAFGASRGPGPLKPVELAAGAIVVALVALVVGGQVAKRKLDKSAKETFELTEGGKRRHVMIFEGYALVGEEIVPRRAILSADVEDTGLVLRYRDPDHDGVVLRELAGPNATLQRLAIELTPKHPG